jgi:uncharacterized protein YjcR
MRRYAYTQAERKRRKAELVAKAGTMPRRTLAAILGISPNTLSRWAADNGISLKLRFEYLREDYKPQKARGM